MFRPKKNFGQKNKFRQKKQKFLSKKTSVEKKRKFRSKKSKLYLKTIVLPKKTKVFCQRSNFFQKTNFQKFTIKNTFSKKKNKFLTEIHIF